MIQEIITGLVFGLIVSLIMWVSFYLGTRLEDIKRWFKKL